MRPFACLLLVLSVVRTASALEENTQTRLTKYIDAVIDVWRKYPTEKQFAVRQSTIQDLSTETVRELQQLDAPENTTLQKANDRLLANMARVNTALRLEKQAQDRNTAMQTCSTAFKREIRGANDAETELPASKVLERLMAWCEGAKEKLRACTDEARGLYINALSDVASLMMLHATKDQGDPAALYDKNLKDIRNRFPTKAPAMAKSNQAIVAFLEPIAKQVEKLDKKE